MIEHRLKIQELLNENEWELIIKPAILPSEKANKDHISEKERSEMILKELEIFTATLKEYIDECQKMNFEDSKLIKDKNASMNDLQDFYKCHNKLRMKGTKEYFILREIALENTTEKEWKAIIKTINSIV